MRRVVVAVVAISALLLSGCGLIAPTATSQPTDEKVAANLAPFYHQILQWRGCGDGMQCSTAKAPLDWNNPDRDSIELALVRQPATSGTAQGSLLVNPGGPGGSGVDIVRDSVDYATTERVQKNFDIVGFDPRGVGKSSAVSCYDKPAELDSFLYDITPGQHGSDTWIDALEASGKKFGAACLKHTGDLLGFVDTVSAARDMDMLRAALGDKQLNYLGYSYGSILGTTYAGLYPQNTGRLVLDGALDPELSDFEQTAVQAEGFESALGAFVDDCLTRTDCPFTSTREDALASIAKLITRLDHSPLRGADGRQLGGSTMTTAIIFPLYDQDNWMYLRDVLAAVKKGDTEFAFVLADAYNGREQNGTYRDNSLESRIAINCLDYGAQGDRTLWREQAAELEKRAPIFGGQFGYGDTLCGQWPFDQGKEPGLIDAAGSADILVVGTTNDPATPYAWAVALASQLQNGHLITRTGEGHTGYNKGNDCVNAAVDNYFTQGTVPTTDPKC
ncbi:MAG: alpha/beta hydrolase [Microbacteriaceae bacterium]